jgi:hypothetical protein
MRSASDPVRCPIVGDIAPGEAEAEGGREEAETTGGDDDPENSKSAPGALLGEVCMAMVSLAVISPS